MTATNRSDVRHPDDYYRTPSWCVDALSNNLPLQAFGTVIDPGCGDGAIGEALLPRLHRGARIVGIESDPDRASAARLARVNGEMVYDNVILGDFLDLDFDVMRRDAPVIPVVRAPGDAMVCVANPPFKLAMPFLRRALELVGPDGTVCFLLRLNWLAGQRRRDFHRDNPCDVYVLSKRPSFTGGGTDATDYAWFVFGPGPRGRVTVL